MYKKILVPLDGSEVAEIALPHALNLVKQSHGELILLSVVQALTPMVTPDMVAIDTEPIIEQMEAQAEAYLAHLLQKLEPEVHAKKVIVRETSVADAIVNYATQSGVDLIVMSTHGRSGISRWVYGSVAERVLRAAHCPVLLIRAQKT